MKKTKSLDPFLKHIDEIRNKASELNKFEKNLDNLVEDLTNPDSDSFTWLENSPVCTKILDLDLNLKYMSKAGIDKLKIQNISTHYGKPYPLDFYSNSFKIPMQECLEKVIKTKELITHEASILDADGNIIWFESTVIPIMDKEGKLDYLMVVSQDISEKKNIELQVKRSQKFHETLLNTTPDIIYVYDLIEDKNIYSNDGNFQILGYSKEDILAFGSNLLSEIMHPDDYKEYINDIFPKYNKLKDGEIIESEYRIKHKNGNWVWLHSRESIFKRKDGIPTQIIGIAGNISERKVIEFDLKQSQKNLNEALEITQLGTFIFDDSTNLFETSTIADSILGIDKTYKRDPQGWVDLVHPNDLRNAQNLLDDPSTSYVSSEFRIIRPKDKKTIWISGFVKKEFDNNSNRTKIIGTLQDISKRKKAEEKLTLTKKHLKTTFDVSPSIIASVNMETGYFTNANDAVTRILGYTIEEFISKPFAQFIHPDDLQKTSNAVSEKLRGNNVVSFENRYICKNGTYKWLAWQGTLPDENGIITAIASDVSDKKITEQKLLKNVESLKESEELLSLTGELAKVGGWEVDLTTGKAKWSKETKNIHELKDDYQPDLDEAINFYHEDDREFVGKHVANAIKNNEPFNFEARLITQKGNLKYVTAIGQPVFKDNQCIRLYGAFLDITDKKIIELELEDYRKELETENILLKKEMSLSFNFEDMVYSSSKMSDVLTLVEQVAETDANVLILGETGTGKELIAKAIHKISNRKNNSLIRVNCGAIPSELIESELFGHVKGSFTGAINNRLGKFELADGGTLFLDEIGEMPLALQPKLLRAIQEGEIEPIGSSKLKKLDVRIIAATNKDLREEVLLKNFREDLYFRLNVFPIDVPALRDRTEDITVLTEFFVNKYSKKHKKGIEYISDITMQQLKYYNWPGNVRELENLIERAVIVSNSNILVIDGFGVNTSIALPNTNDHRITLKQVQKDHILKTLIDTNWKIDGRNGAAELLDIKPSTLRDRMRKFGIERP